MNGRSVERVSVSRLQWCGWCRWGVGTGLVTGSRRVSRCYICVSCESRLFVYMAGPCICILCYTDTCTC